MAVVKLTKDILWFKCPRCVEQDLDPNREIKISDIKAYFDMHNKPMIALPPCERCGSLSFSEPGFDKKTIKGTASHIRRMLLLRLLENKQMLAGKFNSEQGDTLIPDAIKKTKEFISGGYGNSEIDSNKTIEVKRKKGPDSIKKLEKK
jgi:hypothetical protein